MKIYSRWTYVEMKENTVEVNDLMLSYVVGNLMTSYEDLFNSLSRPIVIADLEKVVNKEKLDIEYDSNDGLEILEGIIAYYIDDYCCECPRNEIGCDVYPIQREVLA